MQQIRVQLSGSSQWTERFESMLSAEMQPFLHKDLQMERVPFAGGVEWVLCAPDLGFLMEVAALATARFVLEEREVEIVRGLITGEYGYSEREELDKIEPYCWNHNDPLQEASNNCGKETRRRKIIEETHAYLNVHQLINIEGFIRFRLQGYMEQLREIVEYAIDEYIMEKQYQEFISLLKYFVYIQDAKIPAAHLMHKGDNEFVLLNEKMEPIEAEQIDQFVVEMVDKEVNCEDMIVSTLITVSPQNLYIHTRHPEQQVIKTIQQIFEDRSAICTMCQYCSPILGGKRKKDQYYTQP